MNQLSGKYVNVVLSVECGRGMDFLRNKVFITANFNGRILESDHIPPEEAPPFNTELVWEVEKKELRRIRCGNLPLRVECVTIDTQNRKERIGFALLSLRSAQIIPQAYADQPIIPSWHKLIGCQADKRKSHPELYISLSLRDHMFNDQINVDCSAAGMPFILEEDCQSVEEQVVAKECLVKYFEGGHIQIGDEDAAKVSYTLNLKLVEVYNLDSLLTESLVFQANSSSYFLTFKILGIIIKTKPFQNQMCDHVLLNERIVVSLLSTREILEDFFKTQTISISFYYGYDKLGVTKLNFDKIWNKDTDKYFFKLPTPDGVIPFESSDKSPYITLETWIEENNDLNTINMPPSVIEDPVEKTKTRSIFSNVCKKSARNIDSKSTHNTEEPEKPQEIPKNIVLPTVTQSVDTVVFSDILTARSSAVLDAYEKFIIIVSLKYLIWTTPPADDKIMFKFLHPRSGNCTTIFTEVNVDLKKEISLNNIYVRIAYISTAARITKVLNHWRPKLALADKNEKYITNKRLVNVNCFDKGSTDYEEEFTSLNSSLPIAKIGVNVTLNVCDTTLEDDYENLFLPPVIVDEVITVNEISDLEKWKQEQKILLERELEKVKTEEIARLENEYESRKTNLQDKLSKTFEKCKNMQDQLKKKIISMKINKEFMKKQKNNQDMYDEIFDENWKLYSEQKVEKVIEILSKTQRDNVLLKQICEKQEEEASKISKSMLTKAESNNLLEELKALEEQFIEARNAKGYLKEMLEKSCEETPEDLKIKSRNIEESNERLNVKHYQGFYTEQIQFE